MFLKIGHRGARAVVLENTIPSFKKAVDLGANAIEFDIRKTKDHELVVIHDNNLKRTMGISIPVHRLTLSEIKRRSAERVPMLEETLKYLRPKRKIIKILVEFKEKGCEETTLDAIKKFHLRDRIILISFLKNVLLTIRTLDPNIDTGFLYVHHRNPIRTALQLRCQYLLPNYRFTNSTFINKAHHAGLKLIVWTVNNSSAIQKLRRDGVDGIASDKPNLLSGQNERNRL